MNSEQKGADFISTQVSDGKYYYLNLMPDKAAKETVVCGGRELCTPDYRIERDHFTFHAIEFVSAGFGTLTLNQKRYPLRPGSIYYYSPRTPHRIETDPANPMLKHFVDFTGSALIDLLKTTVFKSGQPLFASRPFLINSIFENLITTGTTDSPNRDALCALLLRQLMLVTDDTAMSHETVCSLAWQTYQRCRQHMEQHYLDIATVADAARECFVNPAYLSRLFSQFAGETPSHMLTRLKMGKAADRLSRHNVLIKQVAEEIGYADPYHFSRVFKRIYGVAPETFIRTARRMK